MRSSYFFSSLAASAGAAPRIIHGSPEPITFKLAVQSLLGAVVLEPSHGRRLEDAYLSLRLDGVAHLSLTSLWQYTQIWLVFIKEEAVPRDGVRAPDGLGLPAAPNTKDQKHGKKSGPLKAMPAAGNTGDADVPKGKSKAVPPPTPKPQPPPPKSMSPTHEDLRLMIAKALTGLSRLLATRKATMAEANVALSPITRSVAKLLMAGVMLLLRSRRPVLSPRSRFVCALTCAMKTLAAAGIAADTGMTVQP